MLPFANQSMSVHASLINAISHDKDAVLFWNLFKRSTKPPLDLRAGAAAWHGAKHSLHTAYTYLVEPNQKAHELLANVDKILETFERIQNQHQVEDLGGGIRKTLTSYPQWRLLSTAGNPELDGTAFQFGAGVELALALVNDREMAKGWTKAFGSDLTELLNTPADLQAALFDSENPLRTAWSKRLKENLADFARTFDNAPSPPARPRSFTERVQENWRSKAAFATYAARASVLDERCLSASQFHKAMQQRFGSTDEQNEYLAAIFFTGFCGLSPNLIGEIPIGQLAGEPSVCELEFSDKGVTLVRDYECLARDAAKPLHIDGIPASTVLRTPLPGNVAAYLREQLSKYPDAKQLKGLLPQLANLNSRDAVYGTVEQPIPSWARLRPTLGRILRQQGMDSLQVALLTADFCHTAKSKVYYCTLKQTEVNAAAAQAYRILGFDIPSENPTTSVAFGSKVTPTLQLIRAADEFLMRKAEKLRPGRNCSRTKLFCFHNAYAHVVAYRLMVLFALRETAKIPLPSAGDGQVTYLTEKASAGREGGMAAIVTELVADQIKFYVAHCHALKRRLTTDCTSKFQHWLSEVVSGCTPLELRLCSPREVGQPICTADVLQQVRTVANLAPDAGRKLLENLLRERGVRTEDIDRVLRHEVAGQEACAGVSDSSEFVWRKRVGPILNDIAKELFGSALSGLSKEIK